MSVSSERLVRGFKGVRNIFGGLFRSGRGSGCGLFQNLRGSLGGGVVKSFWDRLSLRGLSLGGCGLSLGGYGFRLEGHGLRSSGCGFGGCGCGLNIG